MASTAIACVLWTNTECLEYSREVFWLGGRGALQLSAPSQDGSERHPCLSPGPNLDHELHSSGGGLVPAGMWGLVEKPSPWARRGNSSVHSCQPGLGRQLVTLAHTQFWLPALLCPLPPTFLFLSEEKKFPNQRERPKVMAE